MFLATGLGHSGTGWFARFMSELGHSCTHEGSFNPHRNGPLKSPDSSWLAVPYLDSIPEVPIVHLVRDPLDVLNSFIRVEAFTDMSEKYSSYVSTHLPRIREETSPLGRTLVHAAFWDAPLRNHPRITVRVGKDSTDPGTMRRVVGYCTGSYLYEGRIRLALEKVGRVNDHARSRDNRFDSWESVPEGEPKDVLMRRAEAYEFL